MANQNPDHPTETVALGEQPTLSRKVAGPPHTKREAYDDTKARLDKIVKTIDKVLEEPKLRAGDDILDNAFTSLNFCKSKLMEALQMLAVDVKE
jgi:hypothetical protein